jgi:hypothetical protein
LPTDSYEEVIVDRITRRRAVMMGLVAGAGVGEATPVAEAAGGRKGKRFTLHIKVAEIALTNGEHVLAGDTSGTLGLGAVALHTVHDPTTQASQAPKAAASAANRALTVRSYLLNGSFKCRVVIEASAPRQDGTVALTGMGAIIDGGGDFRGARGRVQITGTRPADKSDATIVATGRFTA